MTPRVLRLRDAPGYLGLNRNKFNALVRPHVQEIREGRTVMFDRLDLDRWWDEYKTRNGRPTGNGGATCRKEERPVSFSGKGSGKSIRSGGESGFAAALDAARSRTRKQCSPGG